MGIKPGPKPIAESTGKEDKRRRVTPENKPKHPGLKEHDHKKRGITAYWYSLSSQAWTSFMPAFL